MERKGKAFIVSFLIAIILGQSLNLVQAKDSYSSIHVVMNEVNIAINGVTAASAGMDYTLPGGNVVPYSILYNGTTYLPMRKVAELVGMDVSWDGASNTAGINTSAASIPEIITPPMVLNKKEQSFSNSVISVVLNKINISINGSVVGKADMSYDLENGEQVPYSILYNGTTYLPMRKVAELVGKEVTWNSGTNTAGINNLKIPEKPTVIQEPISPQEPSVVKTPIHQQETKPTIQAGQALMKVNFKLPEGSVINGDERFSIICDTVSSNGTIKKEFKQLLMINNSNLYTTYIPVDASGGSASCRIYYQADNTSGYISGLLTDKGIEVLPKVLSCNNDLRKIIEVKEGSMSEVTIEAIKGILFSAKLKVSVSASAPLTSEQSMIGVQFTEKSKDGNVEDCSISYYKFTGNEDEIEIAYTLSEDKEYSLAFCDMDNTYNYVYGDININDEARKTGKLVCQPIAVNYAPSGNQEKMEQLLQEKVKDIIARIIKPGMSDVDKEYAIFKYIQNNTVYGLTSNCNNAYGCLIENVSICGGYAEGTKRLLDAAGIENQIAYGILERDGTSQSKHAWNIVKIGNEYFHLDALNNRFNLNDTDAKSNNLYEWQEGSIPVCNSRFSIRQGLSFFIYNGYVYYWSGDNSSFYFDVNRCRPDGSENAKLFTTKNGGTFILQQNDWIYYFDYEGSKVYKVRMDGSEETLIYSFNKDVRIHYGDIYSNSIYFFAQTGVRGAYKKNIIKLDIESLEATTIATFDEYANMWKLGDCFYYCRLENGKAVFYKMTLDGSMEIKLF